MNLSQIKKLAVPHKLTDSHDEWLAQRNKGIGGSDAGALLGLNSYKSPYALWAEKSGLIDGTVEDNEAMRVGRDLEEYVAQRFTEATGLKVQRSGYSFESIQYPWMLANVDRMIVGEHAGLECKTASALTRVDYAGGEIPASYYAQCYHYMAVTGADAWYIAVLVMGQGFYWHKIDRDETEIAALIEAERSFWDLVQTGKQPPVDGTESTAEAIATIWAESNGETINIEQDADLLEQREVWKARKAEADEQIRAIESQIKDSMMDAEKALCGPYRVSWKTGKRTSLDSKRLKAERPDIYEEFSTTSATRPFRITKAKGANA